jgi:vacuolar protein sorting-associated protein 35
MQKNSDFVKQDSFSVIRQQKVLIVRLLNEISVINNNGSNLIESFKHFNILLLELKKEFDSPKEYYELYIEVYDVLTILLNYLTANHLKLFHLTDIYELIQYSNNLVPRLYLLITCGVAMLDFDTFPQTEILKDMIEMLNGVQHPIKGMFLRYYLLQRCKFIFNDEKRVATNEFKIDFLIANFIEMNKLWIRLQYQGQLREKSSKLKERKEVELLIGYNLVQLTEVLELEEHTLALKLYRENTLPRILKQVISCRDIISQEYLLDILFQIFPESYHCDLTCIDLYLGSFLKLTPKTNISKSVVTLIEQILSQADQNKEENNKNTLDGGILFDKFLKFLKYLNEERPDLPFKDFIVILSPLISLVLKLIDSESLKLRLDCLDAVFSFINFKKKDYAITDEINFLLKRVFFSIKDDIELDSTLPYSLLVECPNVNEFLLNSGSDFIRYEMLDMIIKYRIQDKSQIPLKDLSRLLKHFETNSYTIMSKPELIFKVFYMLVDSKVLISSHFEQYITDQFESLQYCKNWVMNLKIKYAKADQKGKIDFLTNGLVSQYWRLLKKIITAKTSKQKNFFEKFDKTLLKQIFKNLGGLIFEVNHKKRMASSLVLSVDLAVQLNLHNVAFDFLESILNEINQFSDINDRYNVLLLLIEFLQKDRQYFIKNSLEEKLEQICVKVTVKSFEINDIFFKSNLLLTCTHLWWTSDIDENNALKYNNGNNGKRIHEIMNKLIQQTTSNSLVTNYQLCFVLIQLLNKAIYYFIYGEIEYFTIQYLNNIVKLLKNNLKFLERENRLYLEQIQNHEDSQEDTSDKDFSINDLFLDFDGEIASTVDKKVDEDVNLINFKKNLLLFDSFENIKTYVSDQGSLDERFNLLNI